MKKLVFALLFLMIMIAQGCSTSRYIKTTSPTPQISLTGNSTPTLERTDYVNPSSKTSVPNAKPSATKAFMIENLAGNTPSNLANGGDIVEHNGYIYYDFLFNNGDEFGGLRKMSLADNSVQIIAEGVFTSLNILNNRIYCSNDGIICSMNLDGSDLKNYDTRSYFVYVTQDRIYFHNQAGKLECINLDGTNRQTIVDNVKCQGPLIIFNGRCYFLDFIGDGWTLNYNNFYYIDANGDGQLGLIDKNCSCIGISDNQVFYSKYDGGIFSATLDGNNIKKISDFTAEGIAIDSEWLYFLTSIYNSTGDYGLYKMRIDGSNCQRIQDGYNLENLQMSKDYLFYTESVDDESEEAGSSRAVFVAKSNGEKGVMPGLPVE